ncbi:uncharacterized protein LOC106469639 [Limulus polyphemus]|uniref:Uncharacterized protein LOC106469639 n=1 Tax=Limulus polyphemus TaxID=6850 RepID=A0ABM1BNK1_LIMPO|nr:uncharacterized protein LOC106469639 [Limulus polyphemus]
MKLVRITRKLIIFSCAFLAILICFNEASKEPIHEHEAERKTENLKQTLPSKHLHWDNHHYGNKMLHHQLKEQISKFSVEDHDLNSKDHIPHPLKLARKKESDDCLPMILKKETNHISSGHYRSKPKGTRVNLATQSTNTTKGTHHHYNHFKQMQIQGHHVGKIQIPRSRTLFNSLKGSSNGLRNRKITILTKTASGRKLPKSKIKKLKKVAERKKLIPKWKVQSKNV